MPVLDVDKLIENRVTAIRNYHEKAGIPRAQLDVSGGVDSAVMLGLLAKAVGPENITAVYSDIDSSEDSEKRAEEVAAKFSVKLAVLDLGVDFDNLVEITTIAAQELASSGEKNYNKYIDAKDSILERIEADPTILGSFRSCIRAPIGRFMNRLMGNGIRHGTGNECEDRWLRFYQKGGDGEVDTNPIAMLSKGEVLQLGLGLGVPVSILVAAPSPDLHGVGEVGHNDEDELKSTYGVGWTYSKLNLTTGGYLSVGTIERMSRAMDAVRLELATGVSFGMSHSRAKEIIEDRCVERQIFSEYSEEEVDAFIKSAHDVEKATSHKHNPNIPTLGTRRELLNDSILTNRLPEV